MAGKPDLRVSVGRLRLANPVITASGTFGYGGEYARFMRVNALGGLVTKAITLQPREGNPPPRIVETTAGMLNAIGLANVGVEAFVKEKMPYLRSLKTKVIVNVAGSTEAEYKGVVRRLEGVTGIAALEINISCPNVKHGGMAFGADPKSVRRIVKGLRACTRRTLIIKLTPNVTDIRDTARAAEEAGADALSVINTLTGMAIDARLRRPKLANRYGGLSGPAIKPVALACVHKVCGAVKIPVTGGGGIMNAEDVAEFMLAGARAVQVGTANFTDPAVSAKIIKDLDRWCRVHRVGAVKKLTGALAC